MVSDHCKWTAPVQKLEQLERLSSEDTPCRLMKTHTIESYWIPSQKKTVKVTNLKNEPKLQISEFWNKLYMRHTFWSCLIRCADMKGIRRVLLKIQSGHDSVHRWTDGRMDRCADGRTDKVKPVYPLFNFIEARGKMIMFSKAMLAAINSLWPNNAIWWHRSGSTLAQVMACCLTAPSHYLNQCWLIITKIHLHSSDGNFTRDTSVIND